jgi:hypothetical protein
LGRAHELRFSLLAPVSPALQLRADPPCQSVKHEWSREVCPHRDRWTDHLYITEVAGEVRCRCACVACDRSSKFNGAASALLRIRSLLKMLRQVATTNHNSDKSNRRGDTRRIWEQSSRLACCATVGWCARQQARLFEGDAGALADGMSAVPVIPEFNECVAEGGAAARWHRALAGSKLRCRCRYARMLDRRQCHTNTQPVLSSGVESLSMAQNVQRWAMDGGEVMAQSTRRWIAQSAVCPSRCVLRTRQ